MGASIVKQIEASFVSAVSRNGRKIERSVDRGDHNPPLLTDLKSRREL